MRKRRVFILFDKVIICRDFHRDIEIGWVMVWVGLVSYGLVLFNFFNSLFSLSGDSGTTREDRSTWIGKIFINTRIVSIESAIKIASCKKWIHIVQLKKRGRKVSILLVHVVSLRRKLWLEMEMKSKVSRLLFYRILMSVKRFHVERNIVFFR